MAMKMNIEELLIWFEKKAKSELSAPKKEASKHLSKIDDRLEDILEAAERFDYSDVLDPDVYQNYATTIYKKTKERFEDIRTPADITYKIIADFYSSLKNEISSYLDMLSKYLTWLKRDRSYKSKVKQLDRSITRLQRALYKFNKKALDTYTEYKGYEDVIDDLKTLQQLVDEREELLKEIESLSDEIARVTAIIESKKEKLKELEEHPGFDQLETNKNELARLEIIVGERINEIKKLSHKVLKASDSNKLEIDDYSKEILKTLIKDPLGELVKENDGYPIIKSVLQLLKDKSESPVIQMKKEKLERAFENIDEIINGGLDEIQEKVKFIVKQTNAIEAKFEEMEMERKIKKQKRAIENLKIDRDRITLTQERHIENLNSEIEELKTSLEERIKNYTNEKIVVELAVDENNHS